MFEIITVMSVTFLVAMLRWGGRQDEGKKS